MSNVLIDKIALLKMCRQFFTLEFGILDYDEILDTLCQGIQSKYSDRDHIHSMVYGDRLFQGHHEPYTDHQKQRLMQFFVDMRGKIVRQIHESSRFPKHQHIRFVQTDSRMSMMFEVFE
jgi:hypothetical protein